jgi:hypothetical protein
VAVVLSVELWIWLVRNVHVDGITKEEVLAGAKGIYMLLGGSFGEYVCLNAQYLIHIHQTVVRSKSSEYDLNTRPLITFTSYRR